MHPVRLTWQVWTGGCSFNSTFLLVSRITLKQDVVCISALHNISLEIHVRCISYIVKISSQVFLNIGKSKQKVQQSKAHNSHMVDSWNKGKHTLQIWEIETAWACTRCHTARSLCYVKWLLDNFVFKKIFKSSDQSSSLISAEFVPWGYKNWFDKYGLNYHLSKPQEAGSMFTFIIIQSDSRNEHD